MRLLVTGSRGQLGRALERVAHERGHAFVGVDLPEIDVTDRAAVHALVRKARPEAIVNCAAFTAVDAAEEREAEALAANATAVGHLAEAADGCAAVLLQISTDYVFDGAAGRPYREDDPPNPLSAYGRTKLAGEREAERARRHLIVRTAWLFGDGANFVGAIRRQVAAGVRELRVVDDQTGCPTYASDLAAALVELLERDADGTVHAVNDGSTTWFGFAQEIIRRLAAPATVVPIATAEMPRPARRPAYSVLDTARCAALLGRRMPRWEDALGRYLNSA